MPEARLQRTRESYEPTPGFVVHQHFFHEPCDERCKVQHLEPSPWQWTIVPPIVNPHGAGE